MLTLIAAAALYARVTVIAPRDEMAADFEAGYRRHLDWHRAHDDKWSWLGWTVISGERLGWFVDATLKHTGDELNAPVAPAEDVEDNRKNVAPYGRFHSSALYRHRADLGVDPTEKVTAPLVAATWIRVLPGKQREFETALRRSHFEGQCLELTSGGEAGSYLLLRPLETLSALAAEEPIAHESIQSAYTEALRYRSDLSYFPPPAP